MSCKIIKNRERKTIIEYRYEYYFEKDSCYSFKCDEVGKVIDNLNPAAKNNYDYCLKHPEKFIWQGIKEYETSYYENAILKCDCGKEIELYDLYQGACDCPNCGRWYNVFGEELIDPAFWEENNFDYDEF